MADDREHQSRRRERQQMETLAVRLPVDLLASLRGAADQQGVTMSELVRRLLARGLVIGVGGLEDHLGDTIRLDVAHALLELAASPAARQLRDAPFHGMANMGRQDPNAAYAELQQWLASTIEEAMGDVRGVYVSARIIENRGPTDHESGPNHPGPAAD